MKLGNLEKVDIDKENMQTPGLGVRLEGVSLLVFYDGNNQNQVSLPGLWVLGSRLCAIPLDPEGSRQGSE